MKSLLPSCFRPVVRAGRTISDSEEGHYRHIFIVAVSCVGLCVCAREYKCLRDCDNAQFVFHTSLRTYTGEQFSPYPTDGPFKLK